MSENVKLMSMRKTETEQFCQGMIESILCYHWTVGTSVKDCLDKELSRSYSYLEQYVKELGYDRVLSFMEETANEIDHIGYSVGTDSEGCSYNSIIWKQ